MKNEFLLPPSLFPVLLIPPSFLSLSLSPSVLCLCEQTKQKWKQESSPRETEGKSRGKSAGERRGGNSIRFCAVTQHLSLR